MCSIQIYSVGLDTENGAVMPIDLKAEALEKAEKMFDGMAQFHSGLCQRIAAALIRARAEEMKEAYDHELGDEAQLRRYKALSALADEIERGE